MNLSNVLDPYSRKARLYPALLVLAPAAMTVASYADYSKLHWAQLGVSIVGLAGLFWIADLARARGKAVEKTLLATWGTLPSIAMLRHRDTTFNRYSTEAYHRVAERVAAPMKMPTEDEEREDPSDADMRYTRVNDIARARTRDATGFPMVFKENVSYGFRRNLLGLKPIAMLILAVVIGVCTWQGWASISAGELPASRESLLIGAALVLSLVWLTLVTKSSVLSAAREYAKQLLMALDSV